MVSVQWVMVAIFTAASCGGAQRGALNDAYTHFANNDCAEVYEILIRAEGYKAPTKELQSEIAMIRGACLEKEGKARQAVMMYEYIIKNFSDTQYRDIAAGRLVILLNNEMRKRNKDIREHHPDGI